MESFFFFFLKLRFTIGGFKSLAAQRNKRRINTEANCCQAGKCDKVSTMQCFRNLTPEQKNRFWNYVFPVPLVSHITPLTVTEGWRGGHCVLLTLQSFQILISRINHNTLVVVWLMSVPFNCSAQCHSFDRPFVSLLTVISSATSFNLCICLFRRYQLSLLYY